MKIVYLNPIGRLGGAESLLLDLLASLRAARSEWRLELIVPEPGILASRASALGVAVHIVPMPAALGRLGDAAARGGSSKLELLWRLILVSPKTLLYRHRLGHLLSQLKPDVLHSNGLKMHIMSVWACPSGAKVIWHIHDVLSSRPVMGRLLRWVASGCSAAVTVSEHLRKDLRSVCPVLPARTVWNAVDLREFSPVGPAANLDLLSGLPPVANVVRIGLVATMARWKGHKVFLEALTRIRSDVPVRAYVIGDAIYQSNQSQWQIDELRALAHHLHLDSRVGFTGFVARPAEAMRALDVVVHASTAAEPFGLVIAEAMACGKAVIASALGAPVEFLRDGTTGLLHEAGDSEDLARKIERLVEDATYRRRLGNQAREAAERLFDRRRLAAQMIPVYESVRAGQPLSVSAHTDPPPIITT